MDEDELELLLALEGEMVGVGLLQFSMVSYFEGPARVLERYVELAGISIPTDWPWTRVRVERDGALAVSLPQRSARVRRIHP